MVTGKQMLDFQNVTRRFVNKTVIHRSNKPQAWLAAQLHPFSYVRTSRDTVNITVLMLRYPQANLVPCAQSIGPEKND